MRTTFRILGVVSLLTFLMAGGRTFATAQNPVDDNAFFTLLPGLRTAPAPAWLRPGVRINYFSAAASIASERSKLEPGWGDHCPPGQRKWTEYGTGKVFCEADISGTGKGGMGFTQVNVVHVDSSVAVMEIRSYLLSPEIRKAVLSMHGGAVGVPGAGSDLWLSPVVLARAAGMQFGQELKVLRLLYPLGNQRFRAIRFQGKSGSWNFDESTGILIRSTSTSETTVLIPPPGSGGVPQQGIGGSFLAQNTLLEWRNVGIPWASAPAPSWVGQVRRLRYDGTWTMHVPGSPIIPLPWLMTLDRQFFGGTWARYVQHVVQPNAPGLPPVESSAVRVFGPAQIGGLWIHPAALARLTPGQVIDRDQVTRVVTTVGQGTGNLVSITEANEVNRLDYGYDPRSGMLVHVRSIDGILNVVMELRLVSAQ